MGLLAFVCGLHAHKVCTDAQKKLVKHPQAHRSEVDTNRRDRFTRLERQGSAKQLFGIVRALGLSENRFEQELL
jgi:hypothetical protein